MENNIFIFILFIGGLLEFQNFHRNQSFFIVAVMISVNEKYVVFGESQILRHNSYSLYHYRRNFETLKNSTTGNGRNKSCTQRSAFTDKKVSLKMFAMSRNLS